MKHMIFKQLTLYKGDHSEGRWKEMDMCTLTQKQPWVGGTLCWQSSPWPFPALISQRQDPLGPTFLLSLTVVQSQAEQLHNTELHNGWVAREMLNTFTGHLLPGHGLLIDSVEKGILLNPEAICFPSLFSQAAPDLSFPSPTWEKMPRRAV